MIFHSKASCKDSIRSIIRINNLQETHKKVLTKVWKYSQVAPRAGILILTSGDTTLSSRLKELREKKKQLMAVDEAVVEEQRLRKRRIIQRKMNDLLNFKGLRSIKRIGRF